MVGIVGHIVFDNRELNVYGSLDSPLFAATDISKMIDYSDGNTYRLLQACEHDEKLVLPIVVAGQKRAVSFVTETGLYNILSQSRKPIARKWRRIIHEELIELRKSRGLNVAQQFEDWNSLLDSIYFDEKTGMLMRSVTIQGGDVIQVPYERKGE